MPLTYRTDGPWGAGKGEPLQPSEVDLNFYALEQRIATLEEAGPDTVGISNIEVIGSQMMIYLSNGDSYGPFTLPTAVLRFRGEWASGASYAKLDLISVKQSGLWIVRVPFVATGIIFDPNATDGGGAPLYERVFGEDTYIMDIGFSYPGKPGQGVAVGEEFMQHIFVRDSSIATDFGRSRARLGVECASTLVFDICKNGITIGSITFQIGTKVGIFAWTDPSAAHNFVETDVIGIKRPPAIDGSARRLVITIAAQVGIIGTPAP